jgi:hypothetical protein
MAVMAPVSWGGPGAATAPAPADEGNRPDAAGPVEVSAGQHPGERIVKRRFEDGPRAGKKKA